LSLGLYNPEKHYTKKILEEIKRTWKQSVIIEAGYPIIKEPNGYTIEHVDGIGTKGYLHWLKESYESAAIDAFAMNANDLGILGFKPKTMNCHLILQEEREEAIYSVVRKLSELCLQYDIIFTGGETAVLNTLKGMEVGIHMNGFTEKMINRPLKEDDLVYGHLSNGIHSNGLSMARKLLEDDLNDSTLNELTIPTEIYLDILERTSFAKKRMHITGGAFTKLKKLISNDFSLSIDLTRINLLSIFELLYEKLKDQVKNPSHEMLRIFNCGIGFIEIIDSENQDRFEKITPESKLIGKVHPQGEGKIDLISPFDNSSVQF